VSYRIDQKSEGQFGWSGDLHFETLSLDFLLRHEKLPNRALAMRQELRDVENILYVIVTQVTDPAVTSYLIENEVDNIRIEVYQKAALQPGRMKSDFKLYVNPKERVIFA